MKVVFDTNCLYSFHLRDLCLSLAEFEIIEFFWSAHIKQELADSLLTNNKVSSQQVNGLIQIISSAFPDAEIRNYENLIGKLNCRDVDDEHVLAAAVAAQADFLVTFNTKDFPRDSLKIFGVEIISPDDFLVNLVNLYQNKILKISTATFSKYQSPALNLGNYAQILKNAGCPKFAAILNNLLEI